MNAVSLPTSSYRAVPSAAVRPASAAPASRPVEAPTAVNPLPSFRQDRAELGFLYVPSGRPAGTSGHVSEARAIEGHGGPTRLPIESGGLASLFATMMPSAATTGAEAAASERPSVITQFYEQF